GEAARRARAVEEDRKRLLLWDENVGYLPIVTAGTAQAGRVPGIEDLARTNGQEEGSDVRPAVRAELRRPLRHDSAGPQHPVRLMTAARKRPALGQAEAPRHRDGRTLWQQGASDDGAGAAAVHLPQGCRREVRRYDR